MINAQVVVVGGGPGGYAAAFLAADLGLKTAIVDPEANPGGVCVYRGCIPSKALLHVASLLGEARHAEAWGVSFGEPRIDLDKLRAFKDAVVKRLTSGTGLLAKSRKVQYLQGLAELVDPNTLRVKLNSGGEETVQFEHAILATGSVPVVPPALRLPGSGDPRVMDSTTALDLPDVPKSLLVVGGGYIGLELGSVYAALGSTVTVVEMTDGLLPGVDRDLVDVLSKRLKQTMKAVLLKTRVTQLKPEAAGVRVTFEGEQVSGELREQVFDRVLVAVGRRPNASVPGLDRTRVRLDERGFIVVNEQMRTDEPSIFAIGDVAGEPMLAHKASHEGRVAAEVIAGEKSAFAPRAIPAVVFTDPEIAWAGLTETQAQKAGRPVTIAKFPWAASGRALTLDRLDGLTKLVVDPSTERILGVGLVGPNAGELIAEGVLAIEMGANVTDLKLSIHPHPTLTETLMESAEVFFGQATHVYKPKRS
jgi:dihydrolipoamide dehydrogenase